MSDQTDFQNCVRLVCSKCDMKPLENHHTCVSILPGLRGAEAAVRWLRPRVDAPWGSTHVTAERGSCPCRCRFCFGDVSPAAHSDPQGN